MPAPNQNLLVTVVPASLCLLLALIFELSGIAFITAAWLCFAGLTVFGVATAVLQSSGGIRNDEKQKNKTVAAMHGNSKEQHQIEMVEKNNAAVTNETDDEKNDKSKGDGDEEEDLKTNAFDICYLLWIAVLGVASAFSFFALVIDTALVTSPEVADLIFAAIVALGIAVVCALVLATAIKTKRINVIQIADSSSSSSSSSSSLEGQPPKKQVKNSTEEEEEETENDSKQCCGSSGPGCFRCCSVLGLPLILLFVLLTMWNQFTEVHQLVTLPVPGELVYTDEYPPAHLFCDDNNATAGALRFSILHSFVV